MNQGFPMEETDEWHGIQEAPDTTPQIQPLVGQVRNSGLGCSFEVSDSTKLQRFLILGSENLIYYPGTPPNALSRISTQYIERLITIGRGQEVLRRITEVSLKGRNWKQGCLLYTLTLCARSNDPEIKRSAYSLLPDVCRTPTHLFQFLDFCQKESTGKGWGRAQRKAAGEWYARHDPISLAYKVTKCRRRKKMSHRDVIRMAHIRPDNDAMNLVLKYVAKGRDGLTRCKSPDQKFTQVKSYLEAVERAKSCSDDNQLVNLIIERNLVKEHIPTNMLKSRNVWQALLDKIPMTTLIRSLSKLSSLNLLDQDSNNERKVISMLKSEEYLKTARIHPYNILIALVRYRTGRQWRVNQRIVRALERSFQICFTSAFGDSTRKRIMFVVDVSSSMAVTQVVTGSRKSVSCSMASAAMMWTLFQSEPSCEVYAYAGNDITRVNVNPEDRLIAVLNKIRQLEQISCFAKDCARPITYAIENKMLFDAFVVFTDSNTNIGNIHPSEAIMNYRRAFGIHDARIVVVGTSRNVFSIADPNDPCMMDVVGFDSGAPDAIRQFINGEI